MFVRNSMISDSVTVAPEVPFRSLVERLLASPQGKAAVVDGEGKLLGVVGLHDILRKIVPHYLDLDAKLMEVLHEGYFEERMAGLEGSTARDFMSTEVDAVRPDDAIIKAVSLIVENRRKYLPVLSDDGRFLGMVTRRSILHRVAEKTGLFSVAV